MYETDHWDRLTSGSTVCSRSVECLSLVKMEINSSFLIEVQMWVQHPDIVKFPPFCFEVQEVPDPRRKQMYLGWCSCALEIQTWKQLELREKRTLMLHGAALLSAFWVIYIHKFGQKRMSANFGRMTHSRQQAGEKQHEKEKTVNNLWTVDEHWINVIA